MSVVARAVDSLKARLASLRQPGDAARTVAYDDAPERWREYSQRVARCLREVLDGADAAATRSRAAVDRYANARTEAGDTSPVLRLRAWLDGDGCITRVDAGPDGEAGTESEAGDDEVQPGGMDPGGRERGEEASAGTAPADTLEAALTEALVGWPIGAPPPRGMPQPVVVRLRFAGAG